MSPAALLALSALLCVVFPAGSVIFRLDPNGQQCISEDAGSEQVLVYVQYNVTSRPDDAVKVALEVTSAHAAAGGCRHPCGIPERARPADHTGLSLWLALQVTSTEDQAKGKKEEVMVEEKDITDGKVTFISDASEEFRICFRSTSPSAPARQGFLCDLLPLYGPS